MLVKKRLRLPEVFDWAAQAGLKLKFGHVHFCCPSDKCTDANCSNRALNVTAGRNRTSFGFSRNWENRLPEDVHEWLLVASKRYNSFNSKRLEKLDAEKREARKLRRRAAKVHPADAGERTAR